jgi:hypothetical protein
MASEQIKTSDLYANDLKQNIADITSLLTDQKIAFEQLKKQSKNLLTDTQKLNSTNKDHQEKLDKAAKSAQKLSQEQKELLRNQKALEAQRKKGLAQLAKLEHQERELQKAAKMQVKSLDDLKTKTNALVKIRSRLDTTTKQGRQEFKRLTKEIKVNTNALKYNDAQIGRFQRNVGNYASALKGFGASLGIFVGGAALIGGLKKVVNQISVFEKAVDRVQAITGATNVEIQSLKNNALELGRTTSKTATNVADLQTEFAKLGFSTKEILNATDATIQLSIAAGSDLAESATIAASTIRGFGEDTDQTQRFVDVMAKSFASSALDINKFSTAMGVVAPVAKNAGLSMERTTAMLAVLTNAGVDASTAGTGVRNMFLELSKKGITFEEAMEKINSSVDKNREALKLFGKRGATVGTVIAENVDNINQLEKSFLNATGAAKRMADTMENNLKGDVEKAKSAWEGLIFSFDSGSGKMTKFLRTAVQGWTKFLNRLADANQEKEESIRLDNLQNKELNILFESLKNTNLSTKARRGLIEEINKEYGEYLPHLLTEKSTLEEIEKAQKAVNDQLRIKILQQAFQKEMSEILNSELAAQEALVKTEIQREKNAQRLLMTTNEAEAAQLKNLELFQKTADAINKNTVNTSSEQIEALKERFKRLAEIYNIAFSEIESGFKKVEESTKESTKELNENAKAFDENVSVSEQLQKKIDELAKSYGAFFNVIKNGKGEIEDVELDIFGNKAY